MGSCRDNCDFKASISLLQVSFKEVDITLPENKTWFNKYRYDIPVFHLQGEYLMRHKVHHGLLQKKIDEFYENKNNK